jgi:hypothetical protein
MSSDDETAQAGDETAGSDPRHGDGERKESEVTAMNWTMISVGLCFLTAGVLAYRGWWTSWLGKGVGYTVLGAAWFGAGTIIVGVAVPLTETSTGPAMVPAAALVMIGASCVVVSALSPFWMWWRFLPQWVRTMVVSSLRLQSPPQAGR